MTITLIDLIQQTIHNNWASMALSDYHGEDYTYGAVAVPILPGFTPTQIQDIVKHSEARLLFASAQISSTLDSSELSQLSKILLIEDIKKVSPSQQTPAIDWPAESSPNDVMMLNYTSGTTGSSKGVMLPYRAFLGNYDFFKASWHWYTLTMLKLTNWD